MRTNTAITIFCLVLNASAYGAVPFTFSSGTPARASEVNANFQNLDQRVGNAISEIQVLTTTNAGGSVGGAVTAAACPTNTLVNGIGCHCSDDDGSRNFGFLLFCDMAGNGGIAACGPEGFTFDPNKGNPEANITLKCLGATQGDGDILVPTTSKAASADEFESGKSQVEIRAQAYETLLRARTR